MSIKRFIANASIKMKILMAMLTVAIWTFFVKIISFVKELYVAYKFGTSSELDSFLMAFMIVSFLINIIAGFISAAFIPIYLECLNNKGIDESNKLISSILFFICTLLLIVIIFIVLFADDIVALLAPGFSNSDIVMTSNLLKIMIPILLINGLITILASILNSKEKFTGAALAPVTIPVVTLLALFIYKQNIVVFMSIFTVIGYMLNLLILIYLISKDETIKIRFYFNWNDDVKKVTFLYLPMSFGALLMSSTDLINQSIASTLGSGSISLLSYGYKVTSLIISITSLAISTAVLPYFSKLSVSKDYQTFKKMLKFFSLFIFLCTLPIILLVYFNSETIVKLLFERGSFLPSDTMLVSIVQYLYIMQLPFYLICIMNVRLLSSLKANSIIMWGSAINLLVNIVLNLYLAKYWGVIGIALATSLVYVVSAIFLYIALVLKLKVVSKNEGNQVSTTEGII